MGGAKRRIGPAPRIPDPVDRLPPYRGSYTQSSTPPSGYGVPASTRDYNVDRRPVRANYYGDARDYSYGWGQPRWYYYTPFHPAFFFHPPILYGGVMYPGGFHFARMLMTLLAAILLGALVFTVVKAVRNRGEEA